jgi:hypothetical protein
VAEAKVPLIYISYGMKKSGSTLAFELTRAILERNRCPQKRLPKTAVPARFKINFVGELFAPQLEAIEREAAALGYPVVLKTHAGPTPDVLAWVEQGRMIGHCVYRDPREMALSALDHGARARARGHRAFAQLVSVDDAIRSLRKQVPCFVAWSRLPGFMRIYYDDVAFDTQAVVRRLCAQMALDADPAKVERQVKSWRFTQYNKGVPGRAREMDPADSERILREFRSFYEEFIDSRHAPAKPLEPTPLPLQRLWNRIRSF